jgi:hypothetical protein
MANREGRRQYEGDSPGHEFQLKTHGSECRINLRVLRIGFQPVGRGVWPRRPVLAGKMPARASRMLALPAERASWDSDRRFQQTNV